jgi:hypothetical protein
MVRLLTILLLALGTGAFVSFDLIRTVSTGRVRGEFGTITRSSQPNQFWRYVFADWIVLAVCAAAILLELISPIQQ